MRRFAKTWSLVLCSLVCQFCLGQEHDAGSKGKTVTLEANGYFRADDGIFFAESQSIYLYSHLPTSVNSKNGQFEMEPNDDELKAKWRGQPYYLNVYALESGKWIQQVKTFSNEPNSYLDFGPCDPFDQLDVRAQHPEIATAIPAGVKVKDVIQLDQQRNYSLVVYSQTATETTITYALKVALIVRKQKQNEWKLLKTLDAGQFGEFCGTRTVKTRLQKGTWPIDVLLYTDEPAGSSNYIAIHSFILKAEN